MVKIVQEHFDDGTKTFYINEIEDVEPLLDSLKDYRNHHDPRAYKKTHANWRPLCTIPNIIIDKWFREGFNVLGPGGAEEAVKRVKRDYPYLLAVNKI